MNEPSNEVHFPNGAPTAFQVDAVERLSALLKHYGVEFTAFSLNVGAKRAFWTSFILNGVEHLLAIYPDELNILAGDKLYENYLSHEFKSPQVLLECFAHRLDRLLLEGIWALPDEDTNS